MSESRLGSKVGGCDMDMDMDMAGDIGRTYCTL